MTDWDQRELCPDGACVGVIGRDGTCKTCGRAAANWGDERNRGLTPLPPPEESEPAEDQEPHDRAPALVDPPEDGEWNERKLCPDDACIGVIGPDGRCKVCGSAAA